MFRILGLPKALTRKFFSGVMSPKFRSYGGWKCQLCPSAPQNPLVKFSPSTVWWVRGTPSTSQWKFQVRASSRFRAIDVDRLIRMACMWRSILPIQRSLMTLLHTRRGRSRRGKRRDPQYGAPNFRRRIVHFAHGRWNDTDCA